MFNVALEKREPMKNRKENESVPKIPHNLQPYMNRMTKNRKYIEWHYNHSVSKIAVMD